MINASILFRYFSISILIQAISLSNGEMVEKWMEVYQDHFDPYNGRIWQMRYYENDALFKENGPMFIMIGGEEPINAIDVEAGFMFDMATIHAAIMYTTEHRYYGKSHPVPDTTFENLKYLRIDQALSDIEFFIMEKKGELGLPDIPVIVFGSSYSGNLAAWVRIRYPRLVQGAVAVSAPVYVKNDFPEYFDVVADSLRKYDENCATRIKEAFSELNELLDGGAFNSVKLQHDFNLCNAPDFSKSRDILILAASLAQFIGDLVVHNLVESNGETSVANLCRMMTENGETKSGYQALARIISTIHMNHAPCLELDYDKAMIVHKDTSWSTPLSDSRMWNYQTCTELGYKQTLSSPNSIFGSRVTLQYYMGICEDVFGENYSSDVLKDNIKRINLLYNARLSNTTNIIFINGDLDPWHVLSVLHDLNDDSIAILMPGTSHCQFMYPRRPNDPLSLNSGRCRVAGALYNILI